MKRVLSIIILFVFIFLGFQLAIGFAKKGHEITYTIKSNNQDFNIKETYKKKNNDYYDITIENDTEKYLYILNNNWNKQKKIIKEIKYYKNNEESCIYPIFIDNSGSHIECYLNGINYSSDSFSNQSFIKTIKEELEQEGYSFSDTNDINTIESIGNTVVYKNNLIETDTITLWNYKGISIINKNNLKSQIVLGFDKYVNNHGILVDNYYIVPNYLSERVNEFSELYIISISDNKINKLKLDYTLSSNTYINGIIDNKLYYTDPSNLIQLEINPKNKNSRLIGNKELGGIFYNGTWQDKNIYDFVNDKILFKNEIPNEITMKYKYNEIIETDSSYYFYDNNYVYQLSKENNDYLIVLFKTNNLNNFHVVNDTVYYVIGDTLYYYRNGIGSIPLLKNNELKYNTYNRININRNQ